MATVLDRLYQGFIFKPDSETKNPLIGFLILIIQFICLMFADPTIIILLIGLVLCEFTIEKELKLVIKLILGVLPAVIIITAITWLFSGFQGALIVLLRLIFGSITFSFFVTFTNPADLTRTLEKFRIPPRFALIPSLVLTFVPRIIKDTQETFETLSLRGEIGRRSQILVWLPKTLAIIIASTLYRSEYLAQALYFRGFGLSSKIRYKKVTLLKKDILRITYWVLFIIILILMRKVSLT